MVNVIRTSHGWSKCGVHGVQNFKKKEGKNTIEIKSSGTDNLLVYVNDPKHELEIMNKNLIFTHIFTRKDIKLGWIHKNKSLSSLLIYLNCEPRTACVWRAAKGLRFPHFLQKRVRFPEKEETIFSLAVYWSSATNRYKLYSKRNNN